MPPDPGHEPDAEERARPRERRRFLTPEQRRFLATPRSAPEADVAGEDGSAASPPLEAQPRVELPARPDDTEQADLSPTIPAAAPAKEGVSRRSATANIAPATARSRAVELRSAIFVIALLLFVALAFYAGKKFDHLRHLIASRKNAAELDQIAQKFPGLSADELVTTGLAARKRGDWRDAVERLMAAKRKNLTLPGILFLVGKGNFDRGDLDGADAAFAHAIRFGENIAASNYHRGLIAVRRHDTSAATRFFEAAANAEPFASDMYYFWAEALRLDKRPTEAIRRYQDSEARTLNPDDATLCQFKIRLARIEAAEAANLATEIEAKRAAESLSVDWVMTDAALRLHQGKIAEAVQLIGEARSRGASGLFLTCAGDTVFRKAAETHADVANALRTTAAATP